MLGLGLDLLFGWDCLACDEPLTTPALLCPICEVTLEPPRPPTRLGFPVFAGGAHTGALARAIHRLKYRDAAFAAQCTGGSLASPVARLGRQVQRIAHCIAFRKTSVVPVSSATPPGMTMTRKRAPLAAIRAECKATGGE